MVLVYQQDKFFPVPEALDFSACIVEQNPYFDPVGVFKGEHVFTQKWIGPRTNIGQDIITRLLDIPELDSNSIDGIQILEAQKPFDVHSDYILTDHQVPISDPEKCKPTYTVVIPLVTGDYHTIVFDQSAEYNKFMDYKDNNPVLENHVSDADWQKYLSHCHAEDQKYLTIKKVFTWHAGDMFAFHRTLFHAAANFTVPKTGIVAWLSKFS